MKNMLAPLIPGIYIYIYICIPCLCMLTISSSSEFKFQMLRYRNNCNMSAISTWTGSVMVLCMHNISYQKL